MVQIEHRTVNDPESEILTILERDGGVIIDEVLDSGAIVQIREELTPYLEVSKSGSNEFSGFQTKRIGALMARSPMCRELAMHPLINSLCSRYLSQYSDGYQLHFTQAVSIGPDEDCQILHRDRGVWGNYMNRSIETQFSTIGRYQNSHVQTALHKSSRDHTNGIKTGFLQKRTRFPPKCPQVR